MLSGLLKSDIAVEINIKRIWNIAVSNWNHKTLPYAFTEERDVMRYYLINNKDIYKSLSNINNKLIEHDEKLDYIFSKFDKKELN